MAALFPGSTGEGFCVCKGAEALAPNSGEEGNRTAEADGTPITSFGELDKTESVKLGIVILKSCFSILARCVAAVVYEGSVD